MLANIMVQEYMYNLIVHKLVHVKHNTALLFPGMIHDIWC